VSHGWHVGLVVRRADVPPGRWPQLRDFEAFPYVEVGWGDRDFYRAPAGTSGLALKAALGSEASVLHVVGLAHPAASAARPDDVLALRVPAAGVAGLAAFLEAAYATDGAGRPVPLGPGLYGPSRFYLARERYSLLATCNVWTARALRAAGCPLSPTLALTAGALLGRARAACGAPDGGLGAPADGAAAGAPGASAPAAPRVPLTAREPPPKVPSGMEGPA
jgi:uncharacterized protein (TIGR02117 family)